MRILIVEDEIRLAEALVQIMKESKYAVDAVHDEEAGYDHAMNGIYDVINIATVRKTGYYLEVEK